MSNQERKRLDRLRQRCDVLRARIGGTWKKEPAQISGWRQDLSALVWAIEKIEEIDQCQAENSHTSSA